MRGSKPDQCVQPSDARGLHTLDFFGVLKVPGIRHEIAPLRSGGRVIRASLCLLLVLALPVGNALASMAQDAAKLGKLRSTAGDSAASPADRRAAINALAKYGSRRALKVTLSLLEKERVEAIKRAMISSLRQFDFLEARLGLVGILKDSNESAGIRGLAATTLRQSGDTGIDALLNLLDDEDEQVSQIVERTLSSVRDDPKVTKALQWVAQDAYEKIALATGRDTRAKAIGQARKLLITLRDRSLDSAFRKWLATVAESDSITLAAEAIRLLSKEDSRGAAELALKMATNESLRQDVVACASVCLALARDASEPSILALADLCPKVRVALARDLNRFDPKSRKRLIGEVRSTLFGRKRDPKDSLRRSNLLRLFAQVKDPESDSLAMEGLKDSQPSVIATAMLALESKVKDRATIKALDRIFEEQTGDIRAQAAILLHPSRSESKKWHKALALELACEDVERQLVALELLAQVGYVAALDSVYALLQSPEWPVRSAAIEFCLQTRHKSCIPHLIDRLGKESGRVANECEEALVSLTGKSYAKADYWERWWTASGGKFEVPPAPKAGTAKVAGAVTYHGIAVQSDRICFVVDTSGSMSTKGKTGGGPSRLKRAKLALLRVVDQIDPAVKLNLITFSGDAKSWSPKLREAEGEALDDFRQFVEGLKPVGGTNLYAALKRAFEDEEVDTLYVLSDGAPSIGEIVARDEILAEVKRWNRSRRITIHSIAIGMKSPLMRGMADYSGGTYVEQ